MQEDSDTQKIKGIAKRLHKALKENGYIFFHINRTFMYQRLCNKLNLVYFVHSNR